MQHCALCTADSTVYSTVHSTVYSTVCGTVYSTVSGQISSRMSGQLDSRGARSTDLGWFSGRFQLRFSGFQFFQKKKMVCFCFFDLGQPWEAVRTRGGTQTNQKKTVKKCPLFKHAKSGLFFRKFSIHFEEF